jgi:hypothetical protein
MNEQIRKMLTEALDNLLDLKEAEAMGNEFGNAEREFLCRWVITHPDDRSLAMWREYQPEEDS